MPDVSWSGMLIPQMAPLEVVIRASLLYFFVQLVLRLVGPKELSRNGSYDFAALFLIAVGTRTAILGNDTSLASAFIGVSTLFFWKWALSPMSSRSQAARGLLLGHPGQVMRDGQVDQHELLRHHLSVEELRSELRAGHGTDDLEQVSAAFLFLVPTGSSRSCSVVERAPRGRR